MTGGKLGLLFDLHSSGIFTKANMQTPQILHDFKENESLVDHRGPTNRERNFEKRIAWATLGGSGLQYR